MDKEYIEEITIANAATNFPGIDVSVVRDYMNGDLKPQTNADRIRSMSDEELAEWIISITEDDTDGWLDWLRKEAQP